MWSKGFTLIEMMVAVSIFAIVALVGTSALITANRVNQHAQQIKTAVDNLHFALASMVFKLKQGGNYYCSSSLASTPNEYSGLPQNCSSGGSGIAMQTPISSANPQTVAYYLENDQLVYWHDGVANKITAETVKITALEFTVKNAEVINGDPEGNPYVLITLSGQIQLPNQSPMTFNLQTSVTERI